MVASDLLQRKVVADLSDIGAPIVFTGFTGLDMMYMMIMIIT
jgi:hypothetical protein